MRLSRSKRNRQGWLLDLSGVSQSFLRRLAGQRWRTCRRGRRLVTGGSRVWFVIGWGQLLANLLQDWHPCHCQMTVLQYNPATCLLTLLDHFLCYWSLLMTSTISPRRSWPDRMAVGNELLAKLIDDVKSNCRDQLIGTDDSQDEQSLECSKALLVGGEHFFHLRVLQSHRSSSSHQYTWTLLRNSANLSISDNLYISPGLLALIHSEPLGFSVKKSSKATPLVSKNLNCSEVISPLNSDNLVANKNDSNNLSFSKNRSANVRVQRVQEVSFEGLRRIDRLENLSDLMMDWVKSSMSMVSEFWYIGSMLPRSQMAKNKQAAYWLTGLYY